VFVRNNPSSARGSHQSFNRSIRTPRYQAKDTNLPKTPEPPSIGATIAWIVFAGFTIEILLGILIQAQIVAHSNELKPDHKTKPRQDVFANGSEEKSGERDRKELIVVVDEAC
jgi:hypothetical protein